MVSAGEGLPAEWTGNLAYAPPPEWTHEERKALANSILVEYVSPTLLPNVRILDMYC